MQHRDPAPLLGICLNPPIMNVVYQHHPAPVLGGIIGAMNNLQLAPVPVIVAPAVLPVVLPVVQPVVESDGENEFEEENEEEVEPEEDEDDTEDNTIDHIDCFVDGFLVIELLITLIEPYQILFPQIKLQRHLQNQLLCHQ